MAHAHYKATNTHSEYVILIAFPLQQWLHEGTSMLRYTYSDCLVSTTLVYSGFFYNTLLTEYDIGSLYGKVDLWS